MWGTTMEHNALLMPFFSSRRMALSYSLMRFWSLSSHCAVELLDALEFQGHCAVELLDALEFQGHGSAQGWGSFTDIWGTYIFCIHAGHTYPGSWGTGSGEWTLRKASTTSFPNCSSASNSAKSSVSSSTKVLRYLRFEAICVSSEILTMRFSNIFISMVNSLSSKQNHSFLASFPQESPLISSCINFCSILVKVCRKFCWISISYAWKLPGSGLLWSPLFNPKLRHINNSRPDCCARNMRDRSSCVLQYDVFLVKRSRAKQASSTDSLELRSLSASNCLVESNFSPKSSSTSASADSKATAGYKGGGGDVSLTFAFGFLATQWYLGGWVFSTGVVFQSCFILFLSAPCWQLFHSLCLWPCWPSLFQSVDHHSDCHSWLFQVVVCDCPCKDPCLFHPCLCHRHWRIGLLYDDMANECQWSMMIYVLRLYMMPLQCTSFWFHQTIPGYSWKYMKYLCNFTNVVIAGITLLISLGPCMLKTETPWDSHWFCSVMSTWHEEKIYNDLYISVLNSRVLLAWQIKLGISKWLVQSETNAETIRFDETLP